MFTTPQKPGGAATTSNSPKKVALNGLFSDGVWHCNCTPRLPASHFLVRKEGPNKGRWFYTCQESKENGCGFFLWDDNATGREKAAVINNSRSEPDQLRAPANAWGDNQARNNKWATDVGQTIEGEVGDHPLLPEYGKKKPDFEEQPPTVVPSPQDTPQKSIKTGLFTTPGSKRRREEEAWPTPVTWGRYGDNVFSTPSPTKFKAGKGDITRPLGLRSPSNTPTPSRFRDATETTESLAEGSVKTYDITEEVMELLDQHIDEGTKSDLRQLLNKHALRTIGIAKGRDITRIALKAKDSKIAEQQQKITSLETEREMDKVIIRHLKRDIAETIENKRGRGRGR